MGVQAMTHAARLNDRQRWYLTLLSAQPASTRTLMEGRRFVEPNETLSATGHVLLRLERRGLAARDSLGRWTTTELGREAVDG